jgi:hypothetical protein
MDLKALTDFSNRTVGGSGSGMANEEIALRDLIRALGVARATGRKESHLQTPTASA